MRLLLLALVLLQASPDKFSRSVGPIVGKGVQIYSCAAGGVWVFQAPEATLFDGDVVVGHHGKGPLWTWADGSAVTGKVVSSEPAANPARDIPWLELDATAVPGTKGFLTGVVRVLRWETRGGVAPTTVCDATHLGATARIPYTAHYSFLRAGELPSGVSQR